MHLACGLQDTEGTFAKQVDHLLGFLFTTNPVPSRSSSSLGHLWPETVALPRLLLAITFAFLILSSAALSQPAARPETGQYIRDVDRNGYGQLIIHNDWTMDTVAVLTDMDAKPLVAAYLRSKDTLNITEIEDGSYGLYFTVGNLWDPKEGRFKSVLGYYRYNTPLIFETTETEEDIEYSVFELDLYQARASNFLPDHFDFPDLRS
jgi:hypothetical protein